jgi:UDP-N-acetylmuramoyl-tripeptide--D-alanyl-D-alanine ligase
MRSVLQTFTSMFHGRRHIAVLGDMLELGADEQALHQGIGQLVAGHGLDMLVTVGKRGAWIADAAAEAGLEASRIKRLQTCQEAVSTVLPELYDKPAILVKASRSMEFEQITEALRAT